MRPIPQKLKNQLASDKYYDKCCLCGTKGVQWHHNLIFAGKQVNERFCILPLCPPCHKEMDYDREKANWIMLNRASEEELFKYSKAINYSREKERLNNIYGIYKQQG